MFGIIQLSCRYCNADTKNTIVDTCTGKRKISVEKITFYLLKGVHNINNSSWNKIILYGLVGQNLVQSILS